MKVNENDGLLVKLVKLLIVYCELYFYIRKERKLLEKEIKIIRIKCRAVRRAGIYWAMREETRRADSLPAYKLREITER